jgi:hypothetical protein
MALFLFLLKGIYMALSDTCSDVSWQLASDIVNYLDCGCDREDISKLIDVIFSIAAFQAKQDVPFFSESEQKQAMNRIVVGMFKSLLENSDAESRKLFSQIAQVNINLKNALKPAEEESSILAF